MEGWGGAGWWWWGWGVESNYWELVPVGPNSIYRSNTELRFSRDRMSCSYVVPLRQHVEWWIGFSPDPNVLYLRGSSSAESQGGGVHLSYNSGEGGKQEMSCFTGPPYTWLRGSIRIIYWSILSSGKWGGLIAFVIVDPPLVINQCDYQGSTAEAQCRPSYFHEKQTKKTNRNVDFVAAVVTLATFACQRHWLSALHYFVDETWKNPVGRTGCVANEMEKLTNLIGRFCSVFLLNV